MYNLRNVVGIKQLCGCYCVVIVERTLFTLTPEDITPTFPDPVTFTVLAKSDPDTPITYTWYRYDEGSNCENDLCVVYNVDDKTAITNENGSSLTILKTDESDLGRYRCVASNGVDDDVFEMKLVAPPGQYSFANDRHSLRDIQDSFTYRLSTISTSSSSSFYYA